MRKEKTATKTHEGAARTDRVLHCWADGPAREVLIDDETGRGFDGHWWCRLRSVGSTCLLPDGHAGPHEWTSDDRISVTFAP